MASKEDPDFYKMCLKAHGYTFLEEDVDEDKSESDEESRSMKPPPVPYNEFKHKIVKISDYDADDLDINDTKMIRKHTFLVENETFSDKLRKQTNNKNCKIQKNNLNKYNCISTKTTSENPKPLKDKSQGYHSLSDYGKPKVNNDPEILDDRTINKTQTPTAYNYLLDKNERTQKSYVLSMPSCNTFRHGNTTANSVTAVPRLSIVEMPNHKRISNLRPSNSTEISTNNYLEEKAKSIKESAKSQVHIVKEANPPNNNYLPEKAEFIPSYLTLPLMSKAPQYNFRQSNIETRNKLMLALSKMRTANQNDVLLVKSSNRYEVKRNSTQDAAIRNEESTNSVDLSQIQIKTKTKETKNIYSVQSGRISPGSSNMKIVNNVTPSPIIDEISIESDRSDAWNSVDSVFSRFQEKRNFIKKKTKTFGGCCIM